MYNPHPNPHLEYAFRNELQSLKMTPSQSITSHLLMMNMKYQKAAKLGIILSEEQRVHFILNSVSPEFNQFVLKNWNSSDTDKLDAELRAYERTLSFPWRSFSSNADKCWKMNDIKECLDTQIEMKDLGEAAYVFGIQIIRNLFTLGGRAVVWRSAKKTAISDSTMEVEYIAVVEAAKELVWLRKFFSGFDVDPGMEKPLVLLCDNNGAIANSVTCCNNSAFCKLVTIGEMPSVTQ
ncbi:hypothetical protein CsatA_003865 [Cannabis sativa]